jgi:hypothetical protein
MEDRCFLCGKHLHGTGIHYSPFSQVHVVEGMDVICPDARLCMYIDDSNRMLTFMAQSDYTNYPSYDLSFERKDISDIESTPIVWLDVVTI